MATKEIKSYSLAEMKDKYIGNVGTVNRDEYEYELRMDVFGENDKSCKSGTSFDSRRAWTACWRTESSNFQIRK